MFASYALSAFTLFLIFLLSIYAIYAIYSMTSPRVLPPTSDYGSQIFRVDPLGSGDYTTIQDAIDAAQAETPAASSRWLILIAPGEYQENLTLYDYVDLAGQGSGYSAHLISPAASPAINNAAEMNISRMRITGANDPIIQTGTGHTGTMRLVDCVADYSTDEVAFLSSTHGTVEIHNSKIISAGKGIYVTTGTVLIYNSYFTRDGAESEPAMEIAGAATVEAHHSTFDNIGSGGAIPHCAKR